MDPDDDDKFDHDLDDLDNADDDADVDDGESKKLEYTEDEYRAAQSAKAKRLFQEENGRLPYTYSELSHFIMSGEMELPIEPEDCDFEAIRKSS